MKILLLFCDVDGVLNSIESFRRDRPEARNLDDLKYACPILCSRLQAILDAVPDLKIVISSTWRRYYNLDNLRKFFQERGVDSSRIIDRTPIRFSDRLRGYEIQDYLDEHPEVTKFVILDDNADMVHLLPHLVKTDSRVGLSEENALEVIKRLK